MLKTFIRWLTGAPPAPVPGSRITAEWFEQAVGSPPSQDDLERSNCSQAGLPGHNSCGWDYSENRPVFMSSRPFRVRQ